MPFHVAVIGAGAFGDWTALQLLRRGVRTTLIDAWGPGNSRSSSGGETRVLRGVYGTDRLYSQWVARSLELWRENQQRWGVELYRRTGSLWMYAVEDSYLQAALPIARELGFPVDRLEHAEVARRFPQVRIDDVDKLYFEHESGFLRARLACQTVCRQFESEGGSMLQASARPGRLRSGTMERLELANGDSVRADAYVFACGPWLASLFPELLQSALQTSRQEVFFFGTPAGDNSFDPGLMPLWMHYGDRRFYGFPNVDGRGLKLADDIRGPLTDPSTMDRSPSAEGLEGARRFVAHRFPKLHDAPLLESRVCQYANSPDGHLIVDRHPAADNVWLAGGGSGHGFKFSPALGEHVTALLLDDAPREPRFSVERLQSVRTRTTQFGGAK